MTGASPARAASCCRVQASIADDASAIFDDLAPDDVATTERVLNELLSRARVALAT